MKDWIVLMDQTQSFIDQFGYFLFGVLVLLALVLFIGWKYAESFLKNKFEENLQTFKTRQEETLKKVQLEIDRQLDRNIHSNKNEYEILPEAWSKMQDCYYHVDHIILNYIQPPDFSKFEVEDIKKALLKDGLNEDEIKQITQATDKRKEYMDVITWQRFLMAREICLDARKYLDKNSIFMPQEIEDLFNESWDYAWQACTEKMVDIQFGEKLAKDYEKSKEYAFHGKGKSKKDYLHKAIRDRLSI